MDARSTSSLPSYLIAAFSDVEDKQAPTCTKCGDFAATCVETSNESYKDGECFELSCGTSGCKAPLWAYCKTCRKHFTKRNLAGHAISREHLRNNSQPNAPSQQTTDQFDETIMNAEEFPPVHDVPPSIERSLSFGSISTVPHGMDGTADGGTISGMNDMSFSGSVCDSVFESIEPIENSTTLANELPSHTAAVPPHPKLSLAGNEKMSKFFESIPQAEPSDISNALSDLDHMRNFWSAEHGSPEGHCGGGIQYTVGRAIHRPLNGILETDQVPCIDESLWHLESFSQYLSMNDNQRKRQARILNSFKGSSQFKNTSVPSFNEASKIYGRQGQHSMWNTLPIPPIENIDGIGYANPLHIIKFLFSCGVPVDDMFVSFTCKESYKDGTTVHHVSESLKASEFVRDILRAHKEAVKFGFRFCLATWLADWRDGFGPNRTKGNRNSVVCWTITISPPKNKVNATSNTFLVALGSKKNLAWPKVEHRFRKDMSVITDLSNPLMVYHGTLRKIIPVCCRRLASLEDKVERPDVTATIACTSDFHRCFGTAVRITTPSCLVDQLNAKFLQYEKIGLKRPFPGWSDEFINDNTNGAKLPACRSCRSTGWKELIGINEIQQSTEVCTECTNWQLDTQVASSQLKHPPPPQYPKHVATDDCSLPVPEGRPVPSPFLIPVRLSFPFLISAAKYAFFHTSAPGKKSWKMGECRAYLRTCGIGSLHQEEILSAALSAKESGLSVDYDDKEGIGEFRYPASWIGDLSLHQYIELAMHQLFLGIAKSNYELINQWISANGIGQTRFHKHLQPLMKEIKKLQLSFAMVHEFTGKKEGTGSWVSENWLAFARFSKILYAHLASLEEREGRGVEDVTRMVASFNALVARLLTHSGINPSSIREIHLYINEFLSSVRELDIRVRHQILSKKTTRKAKTTNKQPSPKQQSNKPGPKPKKRKKNNDGQATAEDLPTTEDQPTADETPKTDTANTIQGKETEAWWLKSNYMSLMNLIQTLAELGPLVLWWDGGGKGERFIQDVKPHIPRGIRNDQPNFYVKLTERVYKTRCLLYLEQRYGGICDNLDTVLDLDMEADVKQALLAEEDEDSDSDYTTISEIDSESSAASDDDTDSESDEGPTFVSEVEDLAMHKARTIFVYRNEAALIRAMEAMKPFSGIVVFNSEQRSYELFCVFRRPQRQYGLRKVSFMDQDGSHHSGLWFAPIIVEEYDENSRDKFETVQEMAKMAAIAIPLKYSHGADHDHSNFFCVLTNWWKERNSDGEYVLPTLDTTLYGCMMEDNTEIDIGSMEEPQQSELQHAVI